MTEFKINNLSSLSKTKSSFAPVPNLSQQPELDSIDDTQNVQNKKPQFPDIIDIIERTCPKLMMGKIHKIKY